LGGMVPTENFATSMNSIHDFQFRMKMRFHFKKRVIDGIASSNTKPGR
jgi:hypothetical protein